MKLKQAIADKTYDLRTLEKLRANQQISEKDFQNYMNSIEDMSSNMDFVDVNKTDEAYPHMESPEVDESGNVLAEQGHGSTAEQVAPAEAHENMGVPEGANGGDPQGFSF